MHYPVQARSILIVQLRQVGDVLLTTPAVKALRDHYPQRPNQLFDRNRPGGIVARKSPS